MVKLTLIFFLSLVLQPKLASAGLMIQEVDPYAVLEQDKKKEDDAPKTRTRDEISKARLEKEKKILEEKLPPTCDTAQEFKATYEELISHQLLDFPDRDVVRIAYEVTKGCDGAAERFHVILNLLLNTGVDKRKAVEFALHYARRTDQQTSAFVLIFKGTFLEKYYDMDFKTALATSFKLSLEARGNPEALAKDFRGILDFCVSHKGTDLPFKICAPYALELAMASYLYGDAGLMSSFQKLIDFFMQQKEQDYSIGVQLKFAGRILRHGPKAVENFQTQYAYGISESMKLTQKTSIELAVRVAENSQGRDLK